MSGLHVDGTPVPADASLSQSERQTLQFVRAAHSFSIIFRTSNGTPRLIVDGVAQPRPPEEQGYLIHDIFARRLPRIESVDYRIGAVNAFRGDFEDHTLTIRPGIYVEHGTLVNLVLPDANNVIGLAIFLSDEHLVRHQLHNVPNLAKLAVRTIQDHPDIDVQVKEPSATAWQTLGPFPSTGWIEFDLSCGDYFVIRVVRKSSVPPGAARTERIEIAQVDENGIYGQGYSLDVTSVGNPP